MSNIVTSLIPALILYCINRCFSYQKITSIEKQITEVSNEKYKKCVEGEVNKLEQQNITEPTTEVIPRTVKGGTDRIITVRVVNNDIKDGNGVIRTVEDDHNAAIKGIIAADSETEGYAVGFGLQYNFVKDGVVDSQCGFSTRIGNSRKRTVKNL
ncbi:MAG: hypothetical protein ACR5KV_06540 [Wolbachia sp.]